jgi:hypothetical protein
MRTAGRLKNGERVRIGKREPKRSKKVQLKCSKAWAEPFFTGLFYEHLFDLAPVMVGTGEVQMALGDIQNPISKSGYSFCQWGLEKCLWEIC